MTSVDPRACIRCAACATVAPAHFSVGAGPARVFRAPVEASEIRSCEGAAALCPTQAITVGAPSSDRPGSSLEHDEIYPSAIEVSEGVRWKITDLPWASFSPALATPDLRSVVREMAYSEQTTFSATARFMQAFGDNTDFSQWISVWFYEETRHPMVLLKWMALAGEKPGADFVTRGRVSAPFMKSLMGTLVTNVISEIFAAEAYLGMAISSPEPLLGAISQRICADEARHGAGFFTYARRILETSANPDRERLDALKVLHFWINENQSVSHPVNETMDKVRSLGGGALAPFTPPLARIAKAVGRLTGLPIDVPADLQPQLVEYTRRVHAAADV
jgi:ferredoxin